jgi:hypothetical protein
LQAVGGGGTPLPCCRRTIHQIPPTQYFEIGDEPLTSFQLQFLAALRLLVDGRLRPYCAELDGDGFLLALDIDAPGAPKGQESELIASGFVRGRGSFAT